MNHIAPSETIFTENISDGSIRTYNYDNTILQATITKEYTMTEIEQPIEMTPVRHFMQTFIRELDKKARWDRISQTRTIGRPFLLTQIGAWTRSERWFGLRS
jgi:hypothetical protein